MASMMQPHSQGKPQLISNINAVMAVADVVRTTLGPRGTDKLIHDDKGNTIISNDGATIMKLLDIVHPAAKILADIASEKVHLHYRIMEVEQYKIIEKIGEGASGVVYKALDTKNNVIVALKEIHVHRVNGIKASNLREVSILKKLQHENVVRLLDVVYTRKRLYAVLEYLDMSLAKHIVSCLEYSDDPYHVKVFLLQLLRGIDYCHSKGVMHRDLKPENLLIDLKSKSLKLADFGLSRVIHCKTLTPKVGTLFYIPPEILLGSDKYSFSSDMWSIGCIFAEMVTRKPLFAGDSEARKVVKGSSEIRSNRLRRKVKLQFHIKVKIQFLIKLKLQFLISARCNGGSPTKMLPTNFNGSKVSNYMLRQHMIDVDKREGVIDWLFDMTLGRYQIISFAAVHILDRFLSNHVVSYKEFYHVAVVALHISLKYYETRDFRTPSLDDLITEINGGGSPDPHRNERDLSRVMEKRILEDLGWEVDVVTVHTFLTRFLDAVNNPPDATMEKMAYFYAKLGIRSYDLIIKFPPEMLAAAALYAAYTYTCHIGIRCRIFRVFTGLKRKQLLRCSWRMLQLHWDGLKEEEDWWIYFQ